MLSNEDIMELERLKANNERVLDSLKLELFNIDKIYRGDDEIGPEHVEHYHYLEEEIDLTEKRIESLTIEIEMAERERDHKDYEKSRI